MNVKTLIVSILFSSFSLTANAQACCLMQDIGTGLNHCLNVNPCIGTSCNDAAMDAAHGAATYVSLACLIG